MRPWQALSRWQHYANSHKSTTSKYSLCSHARATEPNISRYVERGMSHWWPFFEPLDRYPPVKSGHWDTFEDQLPVDIICMAVRCIIVKLPRIFPGAPLTFNGAPGNIQGNIDSYADSMPHSVPCGWDYWPKRRSYQRIWSRKKLIVVSRIFCFCVSTHGNSIHISILSNNLCHQS